LVLQDDSWFSKVAGSDLRLRAATLDPDQMCSLQVYFKSACNADQKTPFLNLRRNPLALNGPCPALRGPAVGLELQGLHLGNAALVLAVHTTTESDLIHC
jgi:hypothetical protein